MSNQFDHGYALLIAVNESREPRAALPAVIKDVQALQTVLTHPQRCAYPADHVRVIAGADSTRDGIMAGLDWLADKIKADPSGDATAVIYYTGHGHVEDGGYFLIPYDINLNRIKTSAIRAEDFAADAAALKPRRLLVILDCCHAAGMEVKHLRLPLNPAAIPAAQFMQSEKGASAEEGAKGLEALAQGSGRAVLSSSQKAEKSWVRRDGAMSIFTFHLIEALTGHAQPAEGATEVLVSDVMSHVWRKVPASARADWQAEQNPEYQVSGNFPVALLLGGKGLSKGELAPDPLGALPAAPAGNPTYQASLTGSGAIAQGPGATAVSTGGVYVGGKNTGNINTGAQVNTGGGAYVGGNVTAGRDFVGRDRITQGIGGGNVWAHTMHIHVGPENESHHPPTAGLTRIPPNKRGVKEKVRLDVACPFKVTCDVEFDVAVAVRQPGSPPLAVEDLNNVESSKGIVERKSRQELVKYRVEILSKDFAISPPQLVFYLVPLQDSEVKWFKLTAKRVGRLSFLVIAYQVEDDIEVASTRITLTSKLYVQDQETDKGASEPDSLP